MVKYIRIRTNTSKKEYSVKKGSRWDDDELLKVISNGFEQGSELESVRYFHRDEYHVADNLIGHRTIMYFNIKLEGISYSCEVVVHDDKGTGVEENLEILDGSSFNGTLINSTDAKG